MISNSQVLRGIQKEVEIGRPSTKGGDRSLLESSYRQPPSKQDSRNESVIHYRRAVYTCLVFLHTYLTLQCLTQTQESQL